MDLDVYFIVLFGLLQIVLAIFVGIVTRKIRDRSESGIIRYRLLVFESAFFVYALKTFFHIFLSEGGRVPQDIFHIPHVNLLIDHTLGTLFFVLIGTIGLLYFMEVKHQETVKRVSYAMYALLFLILLYLGAFHVLTGGLLVHSDSIFIFLHIFQISVIMAVTAIIFKRLMDTRSELNPLTLHRKYPFGVGIILLTIANVVHVLYLIPPVLIGVMVLVKEALATVAMGIISLKIWGTYKEAAVEEERYPEDSRDLMAALNRILKHAYYGYRDLDIGEREALFNEFLVTACIADIAIKGGIGVESGLLMNKVSQETNFLFEIAQGMLSYYKKNPQTLDSIQLDRILEFLAVLQDLTDYEPEKYRQLWVILSEVAVATGFGTREHLKKLVSWDPYSTFAYFEERHSTGLKRLDDITGGIPSGNLVLNIRKAEIDKRDLFYPFLRANLSEWRNAIYVTPDEVSKVVSEIQFDEFLKKDRLKVVSLVHIDGIESVGKNLYRMGESSKKLLEFVEKQARSYPLSSIVLTIDLNPLIIKEQPEELHYFVKGLNEVARKENFTVYCTATDKMEPVKLDLLEENFDTVIRHDIIDGVLVSNIAKSTFKPKPITLKKELYDILVYVGSQNSLGKNVIITDITKNFGITAVTARKRLLELMDIGVLRVEKIGRSKYLRISTKGKEFIFSHAA